jgi:mycofactocin precursor
MTPTSTEETMPATTVHDGPAPDDTAAAPLVAEDLLVEDVSIDGMCGVY